MSKPTVSRGECCCKPPWRNAGCKQHGIELPARSGMDSLGEWPAYAKGPLVVAPSKSS